MNELWWLTRSLADVPSGADWLGPREREALATLIIEKRRADWLLGRWTAKLAVAALLGAAPESVEIIAAPDGAPEPYLHGAQAQIALSLSHRAGRALAVVSDGPAAVGCDLELIEPRSGAFVREWLAPAEQGLVAATSGDERARVTNLLWTAKEAAAKVRRGGLRLDVRHALADPGWSEAGAPGWHGLRVSWDGATLAGWWRVEPGWVMSVARDPAADEPRALGSWSM